MLSIRRLFEIAVRAVAPTAERDDYVNQKKRSLRKMLGKPKQNSAAIQLQLKDIEKTKNDVGWGTTKF
jgi:hypothetical protein